MQDSHPGQAGAPTKSGAKGARNSSLLYSRVLLKISGELLAGDQGFGVNIDACRNIASEICKARESGVQLCLVIGGGNIFRGMSGAAHGMDRCSADHLGMLATVMNALALQSALEGLNVETRVQSAVPMTTICEPFIRRRAIRHMEKGRTVIFAAGTGNPFFTTDTGAALRASEMGCDALLKGTQVDGVYTADPKTNPDAQKLEQLSYMEVLSRDLKVMDATAVSMMRETQTPIIVFSMAQKNALIDTLTGQGVCSVIGNPKTQAG